MSCLLVSLMPLSDLVFLKYCFKHFTPVFESLFGFFSNRVKSKLFSRSVLAPNYLANAPPLLTPLTVHSWQAGLLSASLTSNSTLPWTYWVLYLFLSLWLCHFLYQVFSSPSSLLLQQFKLSTRLTFSRDWPRCDGILSHAQGHGTCLAWRREDWEGQNQPL